MQAFDILIRYLFCVKIYNIKTQIIILTRSETLCQKIRKAQRGDKLYSMALSMAAMRLPIAKRSPAA